MEAVQASLIYWSLDQFYYEEFNLSVNWQVKMNLLINNRNLCWVDIFVKKDERDMDDPCA